MRSQCEWSPIIVVVQPGMYNGNGPRAPKLHPTRVVGVAHSMPHIMQTHGMLPALSWCNSNIDLSIPWIEKLGAAMFQAA